VWYEIRTRVNNREPLFRLGKARAVFTGVFRETARRGMMESVQAALEMYYQEKERLEALEVKRWQKRN
jgi:hypothetical protein